MAFKSGIAGDVLSLSGSGIYDTPETAIFFNSTSGNRADIVSGSFTSAHNFVSFRIPDGLEKHNTFVLYNGVNYASGTGLRFIDKPQISGFDRATGAYWGEDVLISGENFVNITGVQIAETFSNNFSVDGETGIRFTVPNESNSGPIFVYATGGLVTTLSGQSGVSQTGNFEVRVPDTEVKGFSPLSGFPGTRVDLSGISLHKIDKLEFTGSRVPSVVLSNPYIVQSTVSGNRPLSSLLFTGVGTTGLSFNIPPNIKEKEKFKLINITGGQIAESTLSPTELHSVYTGINIIEPSSGKYNDLINISGTQLTGVEFLFRSAWSGESAEYIPAKEKTFVDGTGAYIRVPREIINSPITISGNEIFEESDQIFTVLPSISGIETENLIVGQSFRITGLNAYQAAPLIGITGMSSSRGDTGIRFISHNNRVTTTMKYGTEGNIVIDHLLNKKLDIGLTDYFGYDLGIDHSSITGENLSGVRTGVSIITGIINNSFLGEGFPFLVPDSLIISNDYEPSRLNSVYEGKIFKIESFSSRFMTSDMHDLVGNLTGDLMEISGRRPEVSGLTSNSVSATALLGISGRFFHNVTGVKIQGVSATCLINTGEWVSGVITQNPFNCNINHDYIAYIGVNPCTGITTGNATLTLLDYHD